MSEIKLKEFFFSLSGNFHFLLIKDHLQNIPAAEFNDIEDTCLYLFIIEIYFTK